MKRELQGYYLPISTADETAKAFVPNPLPPEPPIEWSLELLAAFDSAQLALGRLDGAGAMLPSTQLFLYMYVRKEAVFSSMIEGTQSSLSDLLLYEIAQEPGAPLDDVREVSNYVAALDHGLKRLAEGFPLSLRLIREMHAILLADGRGQHADPGEFRRSQNWIGGTRPGNAYFVPPPAQNVPECLGALEKFLHDMPQTTPPLLKAALAFADIRKRLKQCRRIPMEIGPI
jgi:Fic family protein